MITQTPTLKENDFFLFDKDTEQEAAPHFHKYAEILFSGKNHLDVRLSQREMRYLKPHEMLIIPPEQVHQVNNHTPQQPYHLLYINLDRLFLLFSPCPYADYISVLFSSAISSIIYRGQVAEEISAITNNIKNQFELKYVSDLINIISIINKNTPQDIINSDNNARKLKFYSTLNELVETEPMSQLQLDRLSRKFFMSKSTFQRQVKRCTGLSFHVWLQKCKMQKALVDLRKNIPVSEIASNLGFSSASHFCKTFKTHYGITPGESRTGIQPPDVTEQGLS